MGQEELDGVVAGFLPYSQSRGHRGDSCHVEWQVGGEGRTRRCGRWLLWRLFVAGRQAAALAPPAASSVLRESGWQRKGVRLRRGGARVGDGVAATMSSGQPRGLPLVGLVRPYPSCRYVLAHVLIFLLKFK